MTRRSRTLALGLTAAVAAAVTGCSASETRAPVVVQEASPAQSDWVVDEDAATESVEQEQAEGDTGAYQAVCVDESTGTRLADEECGDVDPAVHNHGHGLTTALVAWYFLRSGSAYPRVGAPVAGGSYRVPTTGYVTGGLPRTPGRVPAAPVSRPGTGGSARVGGGTSSRVTTGGFGGTGRTGGIGG